jgi:hypothetical protein
MDTQDPAVGKTRGCPILGLKRTHDMNM